MARIFITGSSEGLGMMAGRLLIEQGHDVVLHARSDARSEQARRAVPKAKSIMVGDLSTIAGIRDVAEQANRSGRFDAVIHNVGIGYREPRRIETVDGLSQLWAVNVLAPYGLTALMHRSDRFVYLSSGMHLGGNPDLTDLQWAKRKWNGSQAYSDSKLHDVLLAFGIARRWPDVKSNAVSPGWVATRMGGANAPDDLDLAHRTQAWLATGADGAAHLTDGMFYHRQPAQLNPAVRDHILQDRLLETCRDVSGIELP